MAPKGSNRPSSRREAWERWVVVWHGVFYLTLALPMALALLSGDRRASPELMLGLSLVQGIWYGLIMVWLVPRFRGKQLTIWSLVYLAGAIALWLPLAHTYPAYYLTASSFYGLMWGTLPFGWAPGLHQSSGCRQITPQAGLGREACKPYLDNKMNELLVEK